MEFVCLNTNAMEFDYSRPIPDFTFLEKEIIDGINAQRRELDTCQNTAYVSIQKISLETLEKLIRGLPDGYPIPLERRRN